VRSLIELGEFREARLWADKALERFPQAPELLALPGVSHTRRAPSQKRTTRIWRFLGWSSGVWLLWNALTQACYSPMRKTDVIHQLLTAARRFHRGGR